MKIYLRSEKGLHKWAAKMRHQISGTSAPAYRPCWGAWYLLMAVFTIRRNGPAHLRTKTISSYASRNRCLVRGRGGNSRAGADAVPPGPKEPRRKARTLAGARAMAGFAELIHTPALLWTTLGAIILMNYVLNLPGSLAGPSVVGARLGTLRPTRDQGRHVLTAKREHARDLPRRRGRPEGRRPRGPQGRGGNPRGPRRARKGRAPREGRVSPIRHDPFE